MLYFSGLDCVMSVYNHLSNDDVLAKFINIIGEITSKI